MRNLTQRLASAADADAIAALVNHAYRPSQQTAGWTHEAHLIGGPRTTPEQVTDLVRPDSVVLVLCLDTEIVACVHVQSEPNGAHIGMLAVQPTCQTQGLGKSMLDVAERYADEHFNAKTLRLSVLSNRPELIAFYERRGYARTGHSADYPASASAGQPLFEGIKIETLAKRFLQSSAGQDKLAHPIPHPEEEGACRDLCGNQG